MTGQCCTRMAAKWLEAEAVSAACVPSYSTIVSIPPPQRSWLFKQRYAKLRQVSAEALAQPIGVGSN